MTKAVAIVAKTPRPPVPPLTLDGVAALRRACEQVPLRVALAGAKVSRPPPPPPLPASVVLQVAEIVDTHEHGCGVAVVRLIDGLLCSMLAATDAKARQHDVVTVTAAQSERICCYGGPRMLPRLVLSKKRWNLTGLLGKPPFDVAGADARLSDDGECSSSDDGECSSSDDDPYCNHCGQECSGDIGWWHCELCGEFLCDDCRDMVLIDQNILFGVSCDICGGYMCTACHPGWLMCQGEDCSFEVCEDCLKDSVGSHLMRCGNCKAVFCFACVANAGDGRCADCDEPVWSNDDLMRFRLRAKAERVKLERARKPPKAAFDVAAAAAAAAAAQSLLAEVEAEAAAAAAAQDKKKAKKARAKANKLARGTSPDGGAPAEAHGASAAAVDACGAMLSAALALR